MNHRMSVAWPGEEQEFDMLEREVMEIPLLLTGWEVSALETAAHQRGLTAAEMVRCVLREFLAGKAHASHGTASSRGGTI
jgi:hypothetical protein